MFGHHISIILEPRNSPYLDLEWRLPRDIEIHVIKSKYILKQALEHMHRFWMTAMTSPAFCPKPVFMVSNLTSILANEPWSGKSFEHWTMTSLTMEVLVGSLTWFELCQPSSSQVTFGYGSGNSIFPGLFGYAVSAWQKTRRKSLVMTFGTWHCLLVQKHSLSLDLALIRAQVASFLSHCPPVWSHSSNDYMDTAYIQW